MVRVAIKNVQQGHPIRFDNTTAEIIEPTDEEKTSLHPKDKVLIEAEVIDYQWNGKHTLLRAINPMDVRFAVAITSKREHILTSDIVEETSIKLLGYSIKELHDVINFAIARGWSNNKDIIKEGGD